MIQVYFLILLGTKIIKNKHSGNKNDNIMDYNNKHNPHPRQDREDALRRGMCNNNNYKNTDNNGTMITLDCLRYFSDDNTSVCA